VDIAVIGPCGDVGRQIVQHIIVERLLTCDRRLVLVGNPQGESRRSIFGLAADLTDAYAEFAPRIDVVLDPRELRADLVVMAAGATLPVNGESKAEGRYALAERNAPIFEHYARSLASCGNGHEIVICVSNPNELAVALFAKHLGANRVIGMGAFLDSLRFRKEIASDLRVPRQMVHAFVAGEHGATLVPLWSNVHVYGFSDERMAEVVGRLQGRRREGDFPALVADAHAELRQLLSDGDIPEALRRVDGYPADVRVAARPFVTHFSGAKTVIGTARATMEFLRTITLGADALVAGQVSLSGDVYEVAGTIGVPFVVGNRGVDRIFELPISDQERRALHHSAEIVATKLQPYL